MQDDDIQVTSQECWFQSSSGQYMLSQIQQSLSQLLPVIPGQVGLQIGGPPGINFLSASRLIYAAWAYESQDACRQAPAMQVDYTALPIESDSVNLVVLSFVLEVTTNPCAVLSEIYRVLKPGGQLIVLGLNGASVWGWQRYFMRSNQYPWCGHLYSIWRVKRWLNNIGYGIIRNQTLCFSLPSRYLRRTFWYRWVEVMGQAFLPKMGACYFVYAQKKTAGTTPLIGLWSARDLVTKQKTVAGSLTREQI